jgi:hypothetical protein
MTSSLMPHCSHLRACPAAEALPWSFLAAKDSLTPALMPTPRAVPAQA